MSDEPSEKRRKNVIKRSSRLRSRPLSTMPMGTTGVHGLYVEIANLQMSKARQEKIRDALAAQIAACEAEILRVQTATELLLAKIEQMTGEPAKPENKDRPALSRAFKFKY